MMTLVRKVALLVPYRRRAGSIECYFQKRDAHAPHSPNVFGCWGGAIEEGETPEEAVIRETKEELALEIKSPRYIGFLNGEHATAHVYAIEVGEKFESTIIIQEGEYGTFFTLVEAISHPLVPREVLLIFRVVEFLVGNR